MAEFFEEIRVMRVMEVDVVVGRILGHYDSCKWPGTFFARKLYMISPPNRSPSELCRRRIYILLVATRNNSQQRLDSDATSVHRATPQSRNHVLCPPLPALPPRQASRISRNLPCTVHPQSEKLGLALALSQLNPQQSAT